MLEKREHIDDLFAEYLADYQEKVPDYVWYNLQMDLKRKTINRRISVIRSIAAGLALLLTFGLGYFSSDLSLRKKYESRFLYIDPQELTTNNITIDKTEIVPGQKFDQKKTKPNFYDTSGNLSAFDSTNENNRLVFKLFDFSKDIFSKSSQIPKESNKFFYSKKNPEEKTANQLLIDTLLFKKENLSERGFLLTEKKGNKTKWSVGTKFSPVYSLAENIKPQGINENSPILKSSIDDQQPDTKVDEKSLISFSGGFNVNYHFTRRWSIESGLFYSQHRQMAENLIGSSILGLQDDMNVYTPGGIRSVLPSEGLPVINENQIIGKSLDQTFYSLDMDYITNFEYIELPVIVRYKIVDRRLGLDILSGVTTNFLVGNRSSIIYNNDDLWSGSTEGISPLLYNATFGFGLNYDIYQNFSLNIEPTFKYSIIPAESATLLRYPYSFAIFAGFSFRF